MTYHEPVTDSLVNKTINDLVKEAVESIANDNLELEIPTHNTKGDAK